MAQNDLDRSRHNARQIQIIGSVQGIGFRPALARLAASMNLRGSIANNANGVELHLEGNKADLDRFSRECNAVCPKNGKVERITERDSENLNFSKLVLDESKESILLRTNVPLDRICCSACSSEVLNERNSRYGYLLNSCSDCGPRYTVIKSMPYERSRTSLSSFPICTNCQIEYETVMDRRFHSQAIVCSQCGPQFKNVDRVIDHLRLGNVVAVKGIGGYQFLVMATNQSAIDRIRKLKDRPAKPFVVMVSSIAEARLIGDLTDTEEDLLKSEAGPIVIVEHTKRKFQEIEHAMPDISVPMDSLTSGLSSIGLVLPSTPFHLWLVRSVGPLVVTSANIEGDPMIISDMEMQESGLLRSDQIVSHDREIVRHADDSIVRVMADQVSAIRLGRGISPLPLPWSHQYAGEAVLAVGGQQKVAIALSNGYQAILGPHLGDMDNLKSRERFAHHVRDVLKLYGCEPQLIVHDLHPDFFTTRWAKEYAIERGIDSMGVQHHKAHIASGLWDPKWLNRPILGFSWDGTGFGTDRTIWGGEVFHGSIDQLDRIATLYPFRLPGGELAIYEPTRIAESLLWESYGKDVPLKSLGIDRSQIQKMMRSDMFAPQTTSVGRLFDGVAALIFKSGIDPKETRVGYEGQWAMLMESMCIRKMLEDQSLGRYDMPLIAQSDATESETKTLPRHVWDWRPMIRSIVNDIRENVSSAIISIKFHRALADAIIALSVLYRDNPILLTGGVFQNKILVELVDWNCRSRGLEWSMPSQIPANDGGLSAGQLLLGLRYKRGHLCA
ncbi:MAG: carbamoyltransferase HypF [Pirellula sp.]